MNTLRDTAEALIEDYRRRMEWHPVRQAVLHCLAATYAEASSLDRFYRLCPPLTGVEVPAPAIAIELGKMRKAGLVRARLIAGVRLYELVYPPL